MSDAPRKRGRPLGSKNKKYDAQVVAKADTCPHCGSIDFQQIPGSRVLRARYAFNSDAVMERRFMRCNACRRNFVHKRYVPEPPKNNTA